MHGCWVCVVPRLANDLLWDGKFLVRMVPPQYFPYCRGINSMTGDRTLGWAMQDGPVSLLWRLKGGGLSRSLYRPARTLGSTYHLPEPLSSCSRWSIAVEMCCFSDMIWMNEKLIWWVLFLRDTSCGIKFYETHNYLVVFVQQHSSN